MHGKSLSSHGGRLGLHGGHGKVHGKSLNSHGGRLGLHGGHGKVHGKSLNSHGGRLGLHGKRLGLQGGHGKSHGGYGKSRRQVGSQGGHGKSHGGRLGLHGNSHGRHSGSQMVRLKRYGERFWTQVKRFRVHGARLCLHGARFVSNIEPNGQEIARISSLYRREGFNIDSGESQGSGLGAPRSRFAAHDVLCLRHLRTRQTFLPPQKQFMQSWTLINTHLRK